MTMPDAQAGLRLSWLHLKNQVFSLIGPYSSLFDFLCHSQQLFSHVRMGLPGFDCLFGLILYIPVNNFSVMKGQVFLG